LWIPAPEPLLGEDLPTIIVLSKKQLSSIKIRYEMQLSGPSHMVLFIQPLNGAKVKDWTFQKVNNLPTLRTDFNVNNCIITGSLTSQL